MHTQDIRYWKHDHAFGQDRPRAGERRTLLVTAITFATMVLEILAGMAFGSMALLADGLHMGSHALGLGISAFTYIYARRRARDPRFTFGTGKVNSLGGYTGAVLLVGFAAAMAWESFDRALNPVPIQFDWAIAVAVFGLIVNGASALILGGPHDHQHEHGHAPDAGHARRYAHKTHHGHGHDHNLRSAYLHVALDALTSLLAIVALLAGKYFGAIWLDPTMGVVGALLVSRWAWQLLRDSSGVLLDRQAEDSVSDDLRNAIERDADNRLADFHVWRIGPGIHAAAISVVTDHPRAPEHYKQLVPAWLGIVHTTVEVHRCYGRAGPISPGTVEG